MPSLGQDQVCRLSDDRDLYAGGLARVGLLARAPRRLAGRMESADVPDGADSAGCVAAAVRLCVDHEAPDGRDQGFRRPRPQLHPSKELPSI